MAENEDTYIWYASYGSNISEERFLCYIQGGQPEGATRVYQGCTNKSPHVDQKPIHIPHELYFARKSEAWNEGGVCFINPKRAESANTLGNMYLITREQFLEVVQQENNTTKPRYIDFDEVQSQESLVIKDNSWYGNVLCLGEEDQAPIFTFTNQSFLQNEKNPPNKYYLKTIMKGLIQSHQLTSSELEEYFYPKKGISSVILEEAISMF